MSGVTAEGQQILVKGAAASPQSVILLLEQRFHCYVLFFFTTLLLQVQRSSFSSSCHAVSMLVLFPGLVTWPREQG